MGIHFRVGAAGSKAADTGEKRMSTLEKISFFRNRRDEIPNQQLARDLAQSEDAKGIAEIAENLWNKNRNIQSDCLKVLYEIGYIKPGLIAGCVNDFIKLLESKNNRLVWGAMIGLATIGGLKAREMWKSIDLIIKTTEKGSLITFVWGVKALAQVAAVKKEYGEYIVPKLLTFLKTCKPRDVPMNLDSIRPAMNKNNSRSILKIVESRMKEMTSSHMTRLKKVLRKIEQESGSSR